MLVHRTKEKKAFWEFDSVIAQNMSHNLLLFCAPTWPCYHVTENHLLLSPWSHPLNLRWRRQQPTPQKTTRNKVRHNCAEWYRGVDKTWGRPEPTGGKFIKTRLGSDVNLCKRRASYVTTLICPLGAVFLTFSTRTRGWLECGINTTFGQQSCERAMIYGTPANFFGLRPVPSVQTGSKLLSLVLF